MLRAACPSIPILERPKPSQPWRSRCRAARSSAESFVHSFPSPVDHRLQVRHPVSRSPRLSISMSGRLHSVQRSAGRSIAISRGFGGQLSATVTRKKVAGMEVASLLGLLFSRVNRASSSFCSSPARPFFSAASNAFMVGP